MSSITFCSLQQQLFSIISALFISAVYFLFIDFNFLFLISNFLALILFFFLITNKSLNNFFNSIINNFFGKKYEFPIISTNKIFNLLPYFLIQWLSLCIAFYFLAVSILEGHLSIFIGFIIPLSVILGVLALFTPGGIGVREGALTFLLFDYGLGYSDSITLSVASRVWSLFGELFIFILGWYYKR